MVDIIGFLIVASLVFIAGYIWGNESAVRNIADRMNKAEQEKFGLKDVKDLD